MANHKSAEKRIRQSEKRRVRNRHYKSRIKNSVRAVREAIDGTDKENINEILRKAISEISRAASKGVIPKRRASRKISRLSTAVNRASN